MSSMLTSQGLVLATAMAVSAGTIILFDLFREKYFPPASQIPGNQDSPPDENQVLKSCLSSGSKIGEKEQKKKKKKKRVHFADDVKDSRGNGELYRREHRKSAEIQKTSCGNEILGFQKMPANRVALYSGILKDRVQRTDNLAAQSALGDSYFQRRRRNGFLIESIQLNVPVIDVYGGGPFTVRIGCCLDFSYYCSYGSSGFLGCDTKPKLISSFNELLKGQNNHSYTCEMDYNEVRLCGSISSTNLLTQGAHGAGSSIKRSKFVNHGLLLWNQGRQKWIGDKKAVSRSQQLRVPKLR
ncbi:hypothetical protein Pfo_011987 [Paulownia fortunei]|nr:hypothetical protein Pfo_011987 [Paulownia fortunei]